MQVERAHASGACPYTRSMPIRVEHSDAGVFPRKLSMPCKWRTSVHVAHTHTLRPIMQGVRVWHVAASHCRRPQLLDKERLCARRMPFLSLAHIQVCGSNSFGLNRQHSFRLCTEAGQRGYGLAPAFHSKAFDSKRVQSARIHLDAVVKTLRNRAVSCRDAYSRHITFYLVTCLQVRPL